MDAFEKLLMINIPQHCKKCGGRMIYKYKGMYQCDECEEQDYDDFGIVARYLAENGEASSVVIEKNTGVKRELINKFLRDGRLEIPETSKVFITCNICGGDIRFGKICSKCAVEADVGKKKGYTIADVGDSPKRLTGRMHTKKERE